ARRTWNVTARAVIGTHHHTYLNRRMKPRSMWSVWWQWKSIGPGRKVGSQLIVHDAMPLQDAIDLVHYLLEVTTGFVRFAPGVSMVHATSNRATTPVNICRK